MFWIFSFNSRYYFKVGVETGGHDHPDTRVVAPKQAEGAQAEEAAVPDGEGSKLKVVLGDVSLDVSLRGAGDLRQVNTPGSPAEGREADEADPYGAVEFTGGSAEGSDEADEADPDGAVEFTGSPAEGREADEADPDQESELSRKVAEGEMELLSKIVNGVGIYQFLQQLLKHNSELARLLDVVIRGRNGITSYEQLRPVVEEVQKAFERNREVLVNVLEEIINSLALKEVLRSLKRGPEKLNSVADAVKEHIGGLERLMTAIFERLTKGEIQGIHPAVFVVFLLLALGIIGGIEFTSSKVAYAQGPLPPTAAPVAPTAAGPGQGDPTPETTVSVPPTPAPPQPTAAGPEQGDQEATATETPEPTATVTATPDGTITVTATVPVPVPPTPAPPQPTAAGPGQGITTPEPTATETPPPATIIVTITPSPTATETPTPPAQTPGKEETPTPPAPTPGKEETPTPPAPTVTVQVVTPTGETPTREIVFQIPPTATAVLLDRPPVRPPNTSGRLVEEDSQPIPREAFVPIIGLGLLIGAGVAYRIHANSRR